RAGERYRKLTEQSRGVEARLRHARWSEAERAAEVAIAEARTAGEEVERIHQAIVEAQAAHERANAELTLKRNALAELREQGHELAHELATARARCDTVTRRLAELERLEESLGADIQREEALKGDAARAIATLEAERTTIAGRL